MPYSGIYPYYAQHIMAGIFCAATKMSYSQQDFLFVPAFVGQGASKEVMDAAQKLLFFEGVDVLTGMVNIKVLEDLKPMLETHRKIGLFFDFGELVPPPEGFGDYILNLSMNLWQSEYALGNWAVNEFGVDGQIVSTLFETGFNLHSAFLQGAGAAGAKQLKNFVLKEDKANKNILNLDTFFESIDQETPNFVHAIFNGKLGNMFLEQWRNSKFYQTVPLITVENMAYEDMIQDVQHLGLKFYSSATWQRKSEQPHNKAFVKQFESFGKQQANVFAVLGYEIGLALSNMMPLLRKGDTLAALQYLKREGINGPRGEISFKNQGLSFPLIDINKIITNKTAINQTIVSQSTALGYNISNVYQETVSGWLNPYLSV